MDFMTSSSPAKSRDHSTNLIGKIVQPRASETPMMQEETEDNLCFNINPNGCFLNRFEREYSPPSSHRKLVKGGKAPNTDRWKNLVQNSDRLNKNSKQGYEKVVSNRGQVGDQLGNVRDIKRNENASKTDLDVILKLEVKKLREQLDQKDRVIIHQNDEIAKLKKELEQSRKAITLNNKTLFSRDTGPDTAKCLKNDE